MRYILYNKEDLKWEMVYCTCDSDGGEGLLENIAKAILNGYKFEKFFTSEHTCCNLDGVKNDDMIFFLKKEILVIYGSLAVGYLICWVLSYPIYTMCVGLVIL